jgi:multidrug efflux pump subunit AcrA (membrane-fusion protein)
MEDLMKIFKKISFILVLSLALVALAGCDAVPGGQDDGLIEASGVVEAVEVAVAPEVSGKVVELFVSEGDKVATGDAILLIESEILLAQYDQVSAGYDAAQAALEMADAVLASAEAGVEVAQLNLEMTNVQYDLTLQLARLQQHEQRIDSWNADSPNEFELPVWYFDDSEEISAAEIELDAAWDTLELERANLEDVIDSVSNADLTAAEERLAQAQAAFLVVEELQDRRVEQNGREEIDDYVDSLYDAAEAELESAQAEYDNLLSDVGAEDLLEARARVVVAYERYQIALDQVDQLRVGEEALEVIMAELTVAQAEAMVTQAEALLSQELVQPGVTVLTIGQLSDLTITVYVSEDQYGQIGLGQSAEVSVDSFPDEIFDATVTRIANQAEYTPRNVQTEEDRRTTVFAIELSVEGAGGMLKPGMPADVTFIEK